MYFLCFNKNTLSNGNYLLPYAAASDIGKRCLRRVFPNGNFMFDHLTGSGHSHQAVCYQYLTPNGVRQNPLDFLFISLC